MTPLASVRFFGVLQRTSFSEVSQKALLSADEKTFLHNNIKRYAVPKVVLGLQRPFTKGVCYGIKTRKML